MQCKRQQHTSNFSPDPIGIGGGTSRNRAKPAKAKQVSCYSVGPPSVRSVSIQKATSDGHLLSIDATSKHGFAFRRMSSGTMNRPNPPVEPRTRTDLSAIIGESANVEWGTLSFLRVERETESYELRLEITQVWVRQKRTRTWGMKWTSRCGDIS